MEIIIFGVGIIIGIIMKDLSKIIKTILSMGTTYIMLNYFHPEIELMPYKEWTFANLFTGYNFPIQAIIFFLISLCFFYWFIPLLIKKFIINKLIHKFSNILKEPNIYIAFNELIKKGIHKLLDFYKYFFWKEIKIDKTKKIDFDDILELIITTFTISVHLLICYLYFGIEIKIPILIIIIVWFIIVLYHIIYLPLYYGFIDVINEIIESKFSKI